ncbi:MAG: ABC transporter permease [Clostridiales bacterium]|jgi:putative ABC transport system permease protein|nr:ABC transporter permease [Clostridiales bacterium]
MTLFQIAINNLRRRKSKMVFVVLGLVIGIATIVSVYNVVESMKEQMTRQMAEFGANIVITPDTGELAFSYGGITIPEVLFDVEKLSMADVDKINEIPARQMVRAVAPKLLGVAHTGGRNVIVAGSDLQSEFTIKPWFRLQQPGEMGETILVTGDAGEMDYEKLNLAREDISTLILTDGEVLLGAAIAEELGVMPGDTLEIAGREFQVFALLEEMGSAEDNQVLMNLAVSQEILQRPGEVTVIEVSADYSLGSEATLLAQLVGALPQAEVTSLRQAALGRDEMLTRLTRFGASVSILVLFVGMLVVTLTMSGAVRERTREIGIFRAIGFRKSHVTKIILMEGAMVSLIGGVIGYVAGMVAARITGPLLSGMEITVPWRADIFFGAVLLALFIGALASLYPARQASKLDPAEALRFI